MRGTRGVSFHVFADMFGLKLYVYRDRPTTAARNDESYEDKTNRGWVNAADGEAHRSRNGAGDCFSDEPILVACGSMFYGMRARQLEEHDERRGDEAMAEALPLLFECFGDDRIGEQPDNAATARLPSVPARPSEDARARQPRACSCSTMAAKVQGL